MNVSKADSSSLELLRQQISQDIQPWGEIADTIRVVSQKWSVTVFSNASPNIDIFDREKNVEEETVLYNHTDSSTVHYKISGLSEALDLEIGRVQRFIAARPVGEQQAVQLIVNVLKDRVTLQTFSYKTSLLT